MPEQLVYAGGQPISNLGNIAQGVGSLASGDPVGFVGALFSAQEATPWPNVYADFEAGTVRVQGARDFGGRYPARTAGGVPQMLYGQQALLLQALTTGVVPPGLRGDYEQVGLLLAGRHVDTAVFNAQAGGNYPSGPLITAVGQSETGGGIPMASWISPQALAFQTPAARALINSAMGGVRRGPGTGTTRRKAATRSPGRRRRRKRTAKVATASVARRGRRRHLRKGSPEARRFMARLRKMRGSGRRR